METNEKGSATHRKLREILGGNEKEEAIYRTITAAYSGGGDRTTTQAGQGSWEKERFLGHLYVGAIQQGTLIDVAGLTSVTLARGQENEVSLCRDGKHVIKLNNLSLHDDINGFAGFIDRIYTHNRIYPAIPYEILGFADNSVGQFSVVLKQPYVFNGMPASQSNIDKGLNQMNFEKDVLADGMEGWLSERLSLWDAAPRNVLQNEDGELFFIDVVVESRE